MTDFFITPTYVDYLNLTRNPINGLWAIPYLTFNVNYSNPYYAEADPLNEDPVYQKAVIKYFYILLKEKWLFKKPIFRSLLKYFTVDVAGNTGKITLIEDPDKASISNINDKYEKHIFKYIEKYFITKAFVAKILRQYVTTAHVKWYDLFTNKDTLQDLFAHKIKKIIITTIYESKAK